MRQKLSFSGAFKKGDPDLPYRYFPFDVPAGAKRIEVSYHFTRDESVQPEWGADDVVDIGIFDARGTQFLEPGFRGWSGSARRSFFIEEGDATPGYIRGPLVTGEWNVFLGCRIINSDVMPFWVNVSVDSDPDGDSREPRDLAKSGSIVHTRHPSPSGRGAGGEGDSADRSLPGRWYRGDFHSHTIHSDGYNTIDEYAVHAKRQNLDFLAITDHNTWSHFPEIAARPERDGLLLIPGEEVTTFWGHANVWGLGHWTDFRVAQDGADMQRLIDWVHERGALFSPNHPKRGWPWEFSGASGYRVCEAWQGAWRFYNEESLAFWEARLREGERVVAVGGSDTHSIPPAVRLAPWTLGDPCTWVYVRGPLDEAGVLDGVRAGNVFVSEDPTGPFLEMTASCDSTDCMMGDTIDAVEGSTARLRVSYRGPSEKKLRLVRNGEVWQQATLDREEQTLEFDLPVDGPSYVRAEVAGFRGRPERGEVVHAVGNPLWVGPLR